MRFRLKSWPTRAGVSVIGAVIGLLGGVAYMGVLAIQSIVHAPEAKLYTSDAVLAIVFAGIVGAVYGAITGQVVLEGLRWAALRELGLGRGLLGNGVIAAVIVGLMWAVLAMTLAPPPIVAVVATAVAAGAIAVGIGRAMVSPLHGPLNRKSLAGATRQ
ncbi:hypothetical protein LWF01_17255 [Saxibacter everestensis]|uniref:Uncharacterized protein n=1 Tax=Saxibacter everestensis TaxID=2909229 RepID=A0ABY8QS51_9MICO|nr:hypothetical protein LWF01_17255 [Brevibacteriaceae bacterium ZFBP1038]